MGVLRRVGSVLNRLGPHYLLFIAAGVAGFFWPSPTMVAAVIDFPWVMWVWFGGFIIGGVLCSIGRWLDEPDPKIFGLALILVNFLAFILALMARWPETVFSILLLAAGFWEFADKLHEKVKARDARDAVASGTADGPALAAYAFDRLARSRHDRRGVVGNGTVPLSPEGKERRATG